MVFPDRPEFRVIQEELEICRTHKDLIDFAFYCLNRADTSRGDYSEAYLKVASGIYKLYTDKNYDNEQKFERG